MISVLKTLFVSILVIVVLQIRVGNHSIENHILNWARSSEVAGFTNDVANGAVDFVDDLINHAQKLYAAWKAPSGASDRKANR